MVLNQNPTAAPEADLAVKTKRISMLFFSKSGKVGTPQISLFFQGKCNGISIEFPPPELLINVMENQWFSRFFTKIMKFRGTPQIGLFFQGKCNGISIEFQPPELLINVRGNQ